MQCIRKAAREAQNSLTGRLCDHIIQRK